MSMGHQEKTCPWQPIETAPKDGTVILLYAEQSFNWNGMHVGRYDEERGASNGWKHNWCTAEYQNLGRGISGHVSHWMPLPALPKPHKQDGERA